MKWSQGVILGPERRVNTLVLRLTWQYRPIKKYLPLEEWVDACVLIQFSLRWNSIIFNGIVAFIRFQLFIVFANKRDTTSINYISQQ